MPPTRRIGIVDLDTSHAEGFARVLREMPDVQMSAVYDSGDVRGPNFPEEFAARWEIPVVAKDLAEMIEHVDGVLVLGVNWDFHLPRARPFIEAGKAVFIDKPVAGRLRDLHTLRDLSAQHSAPLMGGSSQRYCAAVSALARRLPPRTTLDSAFVSGPGSTFFYYGSHTAELIQTVLGPGIEKIARCGRTKELFEVVYTDGFVVWVQLQVARPPSFTVLAKDKPALTLKPPARGSKTNHRMLMAFVRMIHSRCPPIPFADSIETTSLLLTLERAKATEGWVLLRDLPPDEGPDGALFAAQYAAEMA
jgi:predicted dehydrogenase